MHTFDYLKKLSLNPTAKTIVMLHGVGSNKEDLFGLAKYFDENTNLFSLNGLFDIGYGRHAWYHLSYFQGKPIYDTNEIPLSSQYILDFLEYIVSTYRINRDQIFLFGFSQGSNISHYILTKYPQEIKGIIALSGRYLKETQALTAQEKKSYEHKKVFIGHGRGDEVIGVEALYNLQKHYESIGISPVVKVYDMPHTIIEEEMKDIIVWLEE